jgi:UDP-glucose 4-epimerase
MPKISITGGSGYVGTALCKTLQNEFEVQVLDRKRGETAEKNFVECDIRDNSEVEKGISESDLVIHAAIIQIPEVNDNKKLGYDVNILGTHNVCEAVQKSRRCKGLILVSSWHTMGERGIAGTVDEKFGLRPDMVEERARAYALSKMGQEAIVRLHDESSEDKVFGLIRIGTALGENMPPMTAANLFINAALKGDAMTPYEHSMYRPMLFVDILDVSRAFKAFASKILEGKIKPTGNSLEHIANVYYPEAITIYGLAEIIRDSVTNISNGKITPRIEVVKKGEPMLFVPESKQAMKLNLAKSKELLGLDHLTHPKETLNRIISVRMRERL